MLLLYAMVNCRLFVMLSLMNAQCGLFRSIVESKFEAAVPVVISRSSPHPPSTEIAASLLSWLFSSYLAF